MSDLTPEDVDLLERARGGHEPREADRRRVRAAIVASLGTGAGLTVGTASGSAFAASSAVAKVVALAAIVGAVGSGSYLAVQVIDPLRWGAQRAAPTVTSTRDTTLARAVASGGPRDLPAIVSPARPGAGAASSASAAPIAQGAPIARGGIAQGTPLAPGGALVAQDSSATGAFAAPVASPPPRISNADVDERGSAGPWPHGNIDAESRLVGDGVAALHTGDPARALALLDQHARAFPEGVLWQERDVERIQALCDLDRAGEARAIARAFLARAPTSPLAARVRRSCAGSSNP